MKPTIKQNPEKEIPVEILAEHITAISQGVKKLLAGPLNERAIVLLIQDAIPGQVRLTDIKAVLNGIQDLERQFTKPKKSA